MALTYAAAIQDEVANILVGADYTDMNAIQKKLMDGTSAASPPTLGVAKRAWDAINAYAQWLSLGGSTTAPDSARGWFVQRMCLLAAEQIRPEPEKIAMFQRLDVQAMKEFLQSFGRKEAQYNPASDTEAWTAGVQNIRYHVIMTGLSMDPPVFFKPEVIDANMQRVLIHMWNSYDWLFKKRQTTLTVTPYAVTDATYTAATKTLTTSAGAFASVNAGSYVRVASGTGATAGDYLAASGTATTLVVTSAVASGNLTTGDIAVTVWNVTNGLISETFRDLAVRMLYFSDSTGAGQACKWATADEMAMMRSADSADTTTGRPRYFRYTRVGALTYQWQFSPPPDQAYTFKCEILIQGPGSPADATATTIFDKFPAEFLPWIRDLTLAESLVHVKGGQADALRRRVQDEIELQLPTYSEVGKPGQDQSARDVNNDRHYQIGSSMPFAGLGGGGYSDVFGGGV